jgi:hypothetical protein
MKTLLKALGNLHAFRTASPDYAPTFGIYAANDPKETIICTTGGNAEVLADAIAAMPETLAALEESIKALEDAREIILDLDPDAHARTRPLSDRIAKARSALSLAGYEF